MNNRIIEIILVLATIAMMVIVGGWIFIHLMEAMSLKVLIPATAIMVMTLGYIVLCAATGEDEEF